MTTTTTRPTTRTGATRTGLTFPQATALVAGREVQMRLRSKSFLISTAILLLSVLASVVIGGILSSRVSDDRIPVAVVGATESAVSDAPGLEARSVGSVEQARELVRSGEVDAAVVPDDSADNVTGLTVIGDSEVPSGVVSALSAVPNVELLNELGQSPSLAYIVALAFGLVFFLSAMTFGATIAQSVVEEKQTRVVEILMSTISVRTLLAGKVIGNSLLAFGQIALIAIIASVGLLVTEQTALLALVGPAVLWFVVFFLFGFVLLASLFAATASLVSRQEDVGSVTSPVTMLVMIPYFLVIFFNDNPTVLAIMSYVPFSAPVGMPMRLFLGTAEWWEPVLSLGVLLASTAVVIVLGSRIYSNSLLRMGTRVKLMDALRG
ncbi:ABC transporter permease [Planctomonas psychrotolerans]|uniref:ABC transporter permease n=1 Tax=Planctomonas psychrotolerans TaxID=2528712 RepID=UPI00123C3D2A|nr:ABC transporter permease [Planctomonas psychrotolerans]